MCISRTDAFAKDYLPPGHFRYFRDTIIVSELVLIQVDSIHPYRLHQTNDISSIKGNKRVYLP